MWELDYKESWTPKNWCLWTVVLQKILRVPWTSRRSKQSTLKEISPKCSLEGLMLKLKHQYFGHLMQSSDSFEKTSMLGMIEAGGEEDDRGWDGWMASVTQWTWVWVSPGVGDGQGGLACCSPCGHKVLGMTEWLNWNWTFFDIASLWDWNENWPFPVLWPRLRFPDLLAYRVQHFHRIIF